MASMNQHPQPLPDVHSFKACLQTSSAAFPVKCHLSTLLLSAAPTSSAPVQGPGLPCAPPSAPRDAPATWSWPRDFPRCHRKQPEIRMAPQWQEGLVFVAGEIREMGLLGIFRCWKHGVPASINCVTWRRCCK